MQLETGQPLNSQPWGPRKDLSAVFTQSLQCPHNIQSFDDTDYNIKERGAIREGRIRKQGRKEKERKGREGKK